MSEIDERVARRRAIIAASLVLLHSGNVRGNFLHSAKGGDEWRDLEGGANPCKYFVSEGYDILDMHSEVSQHPLKSGYVQAVASP